MAHQRVLFFLRMGPRCVLTAQFDMPGQEVHFDLRGDDLVSQRRWGTVAQPGKFLLSEA